MRTRNIFLPLLLVSLYGCQPGTPVSKAVAPAAVESAAPPQPVVQAAAQPVAEEMAASTPVQKAKPVPAEKTSPQSAKEKTTAAEQNKAPPPVIEQKPAPAQEFVVPVAKAEPAASPVETKPGAESGVGISEADALQLAKKNNCLACHALDKKVIGPSFRDVAAKYRGDAGAEARLAEKIAKGGSGAWGVMAMPPSPQVGEADRKTLAKFVLSLK